jgi:hypothetical protein
MSATRIPVSWTEAEPGLVERERAAMAEHAPDMTWSDDLVWRHGRRAVGWHGRAPVWGGEREMPSGVDELLAERRLELRVVYLEAFPAVPPVLDPITPEVPIERRTLNAWHVNGDGTLCMMQAAYDWDPSETAAALVRKASGWFIEYLLADAGDIERMTQQGVLVDTSLDQILGRYAA